MPEANIEEFEHRLGRRLPDDYREFLCSHASKFLERSLEFRSGVIDILLTCSDLIENDDLGQSGIPEESLLHIGGNVFSGYLYLRISDEGFGEIHYLEDYTLVDRFSSFAAFMAASHHTPEDV